MGWTDEAFLKDTAQVRPGGLGMAQAISATPRLPLPARTRGTGRDDFQADCSTGV